MSVNCIPGGPIGSMTSILLLIVSQRALIARQKWCLFTIPRENPEHSQKLCNGTISLPTMPHDPFDHRSVANLDTRCGRMGHEASSS